MEDDNLQTDSQQPQPADTAYEKLRNDLQDALNGWKRTAADFENYKKQKDRENKELIEFAREVAVAKLLPALDSLEQALRHMPKLEDLEFAKKYQNWQTGVNGIVIQLDKALGDLGVKKIESLGKQFDPNFHEAIKELETESADGIIVDELQTGFELNGKVIRPSQVVISKKSGKQ